METINKKIVVFSPHPDDDILACGGTIALKIRLGYEIYVVYMTDGRNSHLYILGISTDPSPSELKKIRNEEARNALCTIGLKNDAPIFLDFEDGFLEKNIYTAEKKVIQILKDIQPVELYFPTNRERHADHRATNIIVNKSLKTIQFRGCSYQYIIHGDQYKDDYVFEKKIVDISTVLNLKKEAIYMHRSQVIKLFPRQKNTILSESFVSKFLCNTEVFWSR